MTTPKTATQDTESAAFAKAYPHLDLGQIPDPWGRPIFKHSHVRALWEGWFARACLDDRAQCDAPTSDSNPSQSAAGSSGTHPVGELTPLPEGAADKAPPAIQRSSVVTSTNGK